MPDRNKLAEQRTELAKERTGMAQERTILAYFRTAAALILFGIAFLGFRTESPIFFWGGWTAIIIGTLFGAIAMYREIKTRRRLRLLFQPQKVLRRLRKK